MKILSSALGILVPLLNDLVNAKNPSKTILEYAKIKGEDLSQIYREHNGPSDIPKDKMWKIHTTFSDENSGGNKRIC